jgi:chemotaxis response regulator CheB
VDVQDPDRGELERVVGIGASAGGVDALIRLIRHLGADVQADLHVPATGRSLLAPMSCPSMRCDSVKSS